jgi:hypothetical protein
MQLPVGTQPLQLWADLPTGSSGPLAVELWQGGTLLTTYFADPAGPAFNFGQGFSGVSVGDPDDGPWCGTRPPGPPPPWWWSLRWAMPTQVSLPGGGTFLVDHVRLSPSAPDQRLATLTHVRFQAVGPQPLVFTGERSQRNGLTFEGNQHFALGNATLTAGNGQLLVNGTAAGDGVEILLGRVNGSEVASPSLPLPPPGSAQTYSVFGDVDGIPDRPAGAMTTQMNSDGNLQVMGDFSAIGATHFTVAVLNGDTLVARKTGLASASFTIQTSNSTGGLAMAMKWSPNGNGGYMNAVKWAGDGDVPIAQPFSPPVHGTRVVVIPEDPLHQLGPQSRLRITANGPVPWPWAIATEKLNLFGHGHTALGSTYMTADTGLLSLANLGPGGTNGVSIDVGNSRSASVTLALDPSIVQGPQPSPWFLQATAFGTTSAQSNQTFGSLSFLAATGGLIQVSADFSPVGSPSQTIEVWSLGQMVQRITGHTGPVCTVTAPPVVLGVQDAGTFLTHFGQPASISIDSGPALQGDTLLVRPGIETPSVSAWQRIDLQGGGMDSIGIGYESDTAALTPSIAGISRAPGGSFQIAVPTVFGYLYTLETVSALGPQPLPWMPVQTFLGDGTTQVIALSNPAYVGGPQGYFRVRLGNNSSGSPTGGPLPDMIFPKHVYFDMLDVTVEDPHDASGGDRPYFATILFQTQGSTDGSTVVSVVDQPPHDWVVQAGKDHMHAGDSLLIPKWMGAMEWNDLQWHTIPDLIQNSIAHPPIMVMGALVIAMDNRNTPPGAVHDLLTQLATALQQQLVTDVESGNLFTGITWLNQVQAAQQLNTRAIALANAAIAKVQPDLIGLFISSLGDPDIPIGVNLLLMPAVPGLGSQSSSATVTIPSFCTLSVNMLERSPDNFSTTLFFRGCNASYRVNAQVTPDFVPPPPQPPNQPDPTLVEIISVETKTGDDDLRSSSTARATIKIKNRNPEIFNLNDPNQGFSAGSSHSKTILLSPPAPYGDVESITLEVLQGPGGGTDDNWDVDGLIVKCNGPKLGIQHLLSGVPPLGNPHIVRLVAKDVHPEKNEFVQRTFPFTH